MEEEYKLILNMEEQLTKILKRSLEKSQYKIIAQDKSVLMIGKERFNNNLSKNEIDLILSMARKQVGKELLIVDITSAVKYIVDIKKQGKIVDNGKFCWMMRQSFVNAILKK